MKHFEWECTGLGLSLIDQSVLAVLIRSGWSSGSTWRSDQAKEGDQSQESLGVFTCADPFSPTAVRAICKLRCMALEATWGHLPVVGAMSVARVEPVADVVFDPFAPPVREPNVLFKAEATKDVALDAARTKAAPPSPLPAKP